MSPLFADMCSYISFDDTCSDRLFVADSNLTYYYYANMPIGIFLMILMSNYCVISMSSYNIFH